MGVQAGKCEWLSLSLSIDDDEGPIRYFLQDTLAGNTKSIGIDAKIVGARLDIQGNAGRPLIADITG